MQSSTRLQAANKVELTVDLTAAEQISKGKEQLPELKIDNRPGSCPVLGRGKDVSWMRLCEELAWGETHENPPLSLPKLPRLGPQEA